MTRALTREVFMKKIAVVLSGCGFKDGSEITEAVGTLIALTELDTQVICFAPDMDKPTVDHRSDGSTGDRNLWVESQRITRGKTQPLKDLVESDFDALVFPGGFGAALHLCDWAQKGSQCHVMPEVKDLILGFHKASKPIGALCIAPVLVAKVLGDRDVTVTIGNDIETAAEIEKTGAQHATCAVNDYITDRELKVVTTPAYMYDEATPFEVFSGIRGLVKEVVEMA